MSDLIARCIVTASCTFGVVTGGIIYAALFGVDSTMMLICLGLLALAIGMILEWNLLLSVGILTLMIVVATNPAVPFPGLTK